MALNSEKIECPRCGHKNESSAIQCANCHLSLRQDRRWSGREVALVIAAAVGVGALVFAAIWMTIMGDCHQVGCEALGFIAIFLALAAALIAGALAGGLTIGLLLLRKGTAGRKFAVPLILVPLAVCVAVVLMTLGYQGGGIESLAWSPDGTQIAFDAGRGVMVLDAESAERPRILKGHTWVDEVAWAPDGERLTALLRDHSLVAWDAETGESTRILESVSRYHPAEMTWSPDGSRLAFLSSHGIVWDAGSDDLLLTLDGPGVDTDIAWSPDGSRLATATLRGVYIWSAEAGELLQEFGNDDNWAYDVEWSPDGTRIAAEFTGREIAADHWLQVWDAETYELLLTSEGHEARGSLSMAWAPDGKRIALGSGSRILVIDAGSGESVQTLTTPYDHVNLVAWSPDGTMLAAAQKGTDYVVEWDAETGEHLRTLKAPIFWCCVW